ncbi:MAG TPA: hypothetical protein VK927_02805, partial [Adhaeribacter sp.]|nr:hypothetical protein [Adhaeribacter sp.]
MTNLTTPALLLATALTLGACASSTSKTENMTNPVTSQGTATYSRDLHSYSNPAEIADKQLDLDIEVNFDRQTISGLATLQLDRKTDTNILILDARDLKISRVYGNEKEDELAFKTGKSDAVFGQPLEITLKPGIDRVTIAYSTSPGAAALQWLNPQQTAGKKLPFLFTQSQAILARTWIPCQDSPGVRFTYKARVKVPKEMLALMSAENPQKKSPDGVYNFTMDKPVTSYLMALAVGDLAFKPLSDRTGIYAEPESLEAAAY